ncbi:Peptidyl-prolyl cis-trans isomerase CWC27 like protein [Eufriesea mexicana]|uniref:Peptidyl-prolyl cis-trans isomerase n=1 Tax=Eufriesea mexicana TaxID=516756 RepID=A0A310SDI9_9HYME|nr:Peptidyl-prolyl cis-trans isomerase CWC27 like protein [Eufriesea mexicana]
MGKKLQRHVEIAHSYVWKVIRITLLSRIIKGFITQGGDPTGTGKDDKIYESKDEFHTRLRSCRRDLIAMANAGKDDNDFQFYFTLGSTPDLQNKHTIFGNVTGETIYNMLKFEEAPIDETHAGPTAGLYPSRIRPGLLEPRIVSGRNSDPRVTLEPDAWRD